MRALICCLLWLVGVAGKKGGVEDELYMAAKESVYMSHVDKETLDSFLAQASQPYMLVLFHIGTCHICKKALPDLDMLAKDFQDRKMPIRVGHVECTKHQEYWKKRLGSSGFPHLMLWHRADKALGGKMRPLLELEAELFGKLKNKRKVLVTKDEALLVASSREANMAIAKDKLRKKGLGDEGGVLEIALEDWTAKVGVASMAPQLVWYPLEALSYEDGSPMMPFKRPAFPIHYRPSSWTPEAMQHFVERMMGPMVTPLKSLNQLNKDMEKEQLPGVVLCAKSLADSPGFEAFAKVNQDKHRAFLATTSAACPVSGRGPLVAVYSSAEQQWTAEGTALPATAMAGPEIAGSKDPNVLPDWFASHRFPGIWRINFETFHQLVHGGRHAAVLAVDTSLLNQTRKVEKIVKNIAKPVTSDDIDQADIYTYAENSTYWGVVDGKLSGMDAYGVRPNELPRIVIFEGPETYVEDADYLSVWSLQAGLEKNYAELPRYSNGAFGFLMKNVYRQWRRADRWAGRLGGFPVRVGLFVSFSVGFFVILMRLGKGFTWVFNNLMLDENSSAQKEAIREAEEKKKKSS